MDMHTMVWSAFVFLGVVALIGAFISGRRAKRATLALEELEAAREREASVIALVGSEGALQKFLERMKRCGFSVQRYAAGEGYTHIVTLPWPTIEDMDESQEVIIVLSQPKTEEHPAVSSAQWIAMVVNELSESYGVQGQCSPPFMVAGGMLVVAIGFLQKK